MGVDVRDMSCVEASALPDRLRAAGLEVEVSFGPHPRLGGMVITRVSCRRDSDTQSLEVCSPLPDKPDECRVFIRNARGWLDPVRRRREQLQAEVTGIIEGSGGYWPYS